MPREDGRWHNKKKLAKDKDHVRHPSHLRGKDIGLFYRNQAKQRSKNSDKSKCYTTLTIPPRVIDGLKQRLIKIESLARKNNVPIPTQESNLFQSDIKTENVKTDYWDFKEEPNSAPNMSSENSDFKKPNPKSIKSPPILDSNDSFPSTSKFQEVMPAIKQEHGQGNRLLSLRENSSFKYGYNDIITETFQSKLDKCLSEGIKILSNSTEVQEASEILLGEYQEMIARKKYQNMMAFRQKLPAYKKSAEILETINNNQVVVISGETGCGKSTQVPQIILDDAIVNRRGGNVKVLVTQPRRIAASSLADRVAQERAENLGVSVGYSVRLETVEPRSRGSVTFCTTGILLALLEVNQGLTELSHVILDEVHERDCHVDLAMCMLKQILQKRPDLKVILMSATLDADSLTAYFNCPKLHIEGLAYPVKDVYLEDILKFVRYRPEQLSQKNVKIRGRGNKSAMQSEKMEKEIKHRSELGPWLESIRHTLPRDIYESLLNVDSEELSFDLIIDVLLHICRSGPGAILVFLPGIADITNLLKNMHQSGYFPPPAHDIYPLHSKLPSMEQKRIFEKPPPGVRKIIIATNIAETSITIDDIVYVVDCGKLKMKGLNVEGHLTTLQTEWISQANMRQRRGRAGRCQPGVCFHLFTSRRAELLAARILPELQRSDLLEEVLMTKKMRLGKAKEAFKLTLDPPDESTIDWAVTHLQRCGALDGSETLTPLGWHLARLPLHPAAGKLLLFGALFGCLDRAASIAAVWGFKDPFMMVIGKEAEVDEAKRQLCLNEPSDHVAISEAIISWENAGRNRRNYAYDNFLSNNTLEMLCEMKRQLGDHLKQMGFLASGNIKAGWENRNTGNLSLLKAIVAAALYPNVGQTKWKNLHSRNPHRTPSVSARTPEEGKLQIHPSSVLATKYGDRGAGGGGGKRGGPPQSKIVYNNPGGNWLVYWLKQKSTSLFLIEVTVVHTLPLLFFGEFRVDPVEDSSEECLISLSSDKVKCLRESARLLLQLRALLNSVLAMNVEGPAARGTRHFNEFELEVFAAVTELITAEDEQLNSIDDEDNSDSDQSDYGNRGRRKW